MNASDLFVFALLAVSAYRLQRFVTTDDIGRRVRELGERIHPTLGFFVSCPWCAGSHLAFVVYAVAAFHPDVSVPLPVVQALAGAAVVGFIGELEPD